MPPHVTWTRRAEQRYITAAQTGQNLQSASDDRAELMRRVRTAFADATDVVVLNYYVGFKKRDGEHILRVDVFQPRGTNTYVVKLAGHDRLARELEAWEQCGLAEANPVFVPLVAVPDPDDPKRLCAIAYQDAEAHIGAESTVWLEAAVQECVRFDRPTLPSVLAVLRNVYNQARRLYESARLESPAQGPIEVMPDRDRTGQRYNLSSSLDLWNKQSELSVRRRVNAAFPIGFAEFFDPVDYFRFLDGEQRKTPLLPDVSRGLAHGDLHGRNLLVGIDQREEAHFPSVFDYEHIHRDNLVGWDFVEMETELKIRCFKYVFSEGHETVRARRIQAFEWRLMEQTRHAHDTGEWTVVHGAGASPEDRLLAILLGIRREAHETLGRPRAWSIQWLHEYLFLLGAYGLTTVRFENQTPLERTAAYISAGVASAFWERLRGRSASPPADRADVAAGLYHNYQVPLAIAYQWNRGDSDSLKRAEELLKGLVERYPASLSVWYESAFNHAKLGRLKEAVTAIEQIEGVFGEALDEDTYGLWGRCHKQEGDKHLERGLYSPRGSAVQRSSFEEADDLYGLAVERYRLAFAVAGGFFSGINLATLLFLRGGLNARLGRPTEADSLRQQSHAQATKLLQIKPVATLPDDNIWIRATQAEAAVLCGEPAYAAERYRRALDQDNCRPDHHAMSMGLQLRRLIDAHLLFDETVPREPFAIVPELLKYFPDEAAS